jgi:hypothetical protein
MVWSKAVAIVRESSSASPWEMPQFESTLALGLSQFGLVTEDGFRKFVEAAE